MRLPVAPATATARLWLAAVASAAVIGGAYLLESHGHSWAAAGLVAAGVAAGAARFLASSRADRRYARVLEHEVATQTRSLRSEERRVGKECRARWSPYTENRNQEQ